MTGAVLPLVVVGAGPGGVAAAVQALRLGVPPLLLERTDAPGGLLRQAWRVENLPFLEPLGGRQLAERLGRHLARFGIVPQRAEVTAVTAGTGKLLVQGSQGTLAARAVILAPGTEPLPLAVPGAEELEGHGLYYGIKELLEAAPRPARAIVLGGGEAALDQALGLAAAGAAVTLVVRGQTLKARGRLPELLSRETAVAVRFGTVPRRIRPVPGGVELEVAGPAGRESLPADGIVAALGRRSAAPGLLPGPGVRPGAMTCARRRGLFVAGDARLGALGQAGMAVGDGLAAAAKAVAFLSLRMEA